MTTDTLSLNDILSLPRDQLVAVPAGFVQDALALKEEIDILRATITSQDEKMAAMAARMTAVESLQEQDITRIYCDIAQDRQRIAKLERPPEPQPMQKDRAEVLHALLAANGGKMLAKDARKKMHLSAERFSNLLTVCDFIERKPLHSDRRKDILILKSELVRPKY